MDSHEVYVHILKYVALKADISRYQIYRYCIILSEIMFVIFLLLLFLSLGLFFKTFWGIPKTSAFECFRLINQND